MEYIEDAFAEVLKDNLNTPASIFYKYRSGTLVSKPGKREVRTLVLKGKTDGSVKYFIKISKFEGFKNFFKKALKGEGFHSSLYKEYRLIQRYQKANIPVMKPVAFCEKRFMGIPLKAFLIIEEVKGELFYEFFSTSTNSTRLQMSYVLGELIGITHLNVIDSIVRPNDVICTNENFEDYESSLVLIDREHGDYKKESLTYDEKTEQLAKMLIKSIPFIGMPSRKEILTFLKAYRKMSGMDGKLKALYFDIHRLVLHEVSTKVKYSKIKAYFE